MSLSNLTKNIIEFLSVFDKVGIATSDDFEHLPNSKHPNQMMKDVKSAIVFVQSNKSGEMGIFEDYFSVIASQNDVVNYLNEFGYDAKVIDSSDSRISFVTMGVKSGVGDISPVNSLVVKGIGLTGTIGVILTNAPLNKTINNNKTCINCMRCLKVCPIRDVANAKGDLDNCACGKCVNICPV